MTFSADSLKAHAFELGFTLVGLVAAQPSPTLDAYLRWIETGMHGTMAYMARPDRVARRQDLNVILPGVRSLVMVGLAYGFSDLPADVLADPARGRIASYAWGGDYHDWMTPRLEALADWVHGQTAHSSSHRVYVDTGAILERSHAQQAGLGFTGKNTMLIHPRRGSYFFLGEILTTLEFDAYDVPHRPTMCGSCTRCLAACPTSAFPSPYVLDARRCISYLTIEHKGWIERSVRSQMGNWVYGCDVCQDVCPWQRFAPRTPPAPFYPVNSERAAPLLTTLLTLDEAAFQQRFHDTAVARIGRVRLVRNACIAAGNWGQAAAVPGLVELLHDPHELIRGHAAWALGQIGAGQAFIEQALRRESHPEARAEMLAALNSG